MRRLLFGEWFAAGGASSIRYSRAYVIARSNSAVWCGSWCG